MKIAYVAALVIALPAGLRSAETPNTNGIFDHLCIGSRLDAGALEKGVEVAAPQLNLRIMALPIEMLRVSNPDTKRGWGLVANNQSFIVSYAEKSMPNGMSRSCAVTVEADEYVSLKSFIETRYKSKKLIDELQGSYRVAAYEVSLMGFQSTMLISIQSIDPKMMKERMTTISFFEGVK